MVDPQHTIARLREERDRLRNEVVALRGQYAHTFEIPDQVDLRVALLFKCTQCGKGTNTPTHAYYDPCTGPPS